MQEWMTNAKQKHRETSKSAQQSATILRHQLDEEHEKFKNAQKRIEQLIKEREGLKYVIHTHKSFHGLLHTHKSFHDLWD